MLDDHQREHIGRLVEIQRQLQKLEIAKTACIAGLEEHDVNSCVHIVEFMDTDAQSSGAYVNLADCFVAKHVFEGVLLVIEGRIADLTNEINELIPKN